ncbi:MAG: bifunctional ornithine acetyltransferase/N-acetylglutamate synthase, partial [Ilumatobacteraceae bacterium]
MTDPTPLPAGFRCHVANIGVKNDERDFVVITADRPVPASGVFTKSRFSGPSVTISREHLADLSARAVVVVSKNANVANGPDGVADAHELVAGVADRLGCSPTDIVVASTGVIGRRYPMEQIRAFRQLGSRTA